MEGALWEGAGITIFNIFNQPVFQKQETLLQIRLQTVNFLGFLVCAIQCKHDSSISEAQQNLKSLLGCCLAVKASGAVDGWLSNRPETFECKGGASASQPLECIMLSLGLEASKSWIGSLLQARQSKRGCTGEAGWYHLNGACPQGISLLSLLWEYPPSNSGH